MISVSVTRALCAQRSGGTRGDHRRRHPVTRGRAPPNATSGSSTHDRPRPRPRSPIPTAGFPCMRRRSATDPVARPHPVRHPVRRGRGTLRHPGPRPVAGTPSPGGRRRPAPRGAAAGGWDAVTRRWTARRCSVLDRRWWQDSRSTSSLSPSRPGRTQGVYLVLRNPIANRANVTGRTDLARSRPSNIFGRGTLPVTQSARLTLHGLARLVDKRDGGLWHSFARSGVDPGYLALTTQRR